MSRLSKLFGSPARPARKARLGVEALDGRVLPSVTFTEHPSDHSLSVVAAAGQNNTITIRNNGNGHLTIVADGTTRTFTQIDSLDVKTGDGSDTVTYNQGTSTQQAHLFRSFALSVDLGSGLFDGSAANHFTANVFGNVGYISMDGSAEARSLSFDIWGGNGADRIDFNFNHTKVRAGSELEVRAYGFGGNDNITLDSDGEVDGVVFFTLQGGDGNDTVAANVLLSAGSTGSVGDSREANVRGDGGTDTVTLAVRQQTGSHADVNAVLDGGFSFGDNDVGRHATNVRTAWLEHDIVVA